MIGIDLKGKIALVTGGSGELGRHICRALAEAGADVAVHGFANIDRAKNVAEEIQATGSRSAAFKADITNSDEIKALASQIEEKLGAPDIVVANAVVQYDWKSILEQDIADYESQFRSCVLQNVMLVKTFVPAMRKKGWGRYIGINSECTMQCTPHQSAYVSGKGGMDRLLRVLAQEAGPDGVTVNQVAPGWMVSDKYRGTDEERVPWYEEKVPLRRRGQDRDIATTVTFLASDLANFISGVYLPVCGGNVMPSV